MLCPTFTSEASLTVHFMDQHREYHGRLEDNFELSIDSLPHSISTLDHLRVLFASCSVDERGRIRENMFYFSKFNFYSNISSTIQVPYVDLKDGAKSDLQRHRINEVKWICMGPCVCGRPLSQDEVQSMIPTFSNLQKT